MKGPDSDEEIQEALHSAKVLRAEMESVLTTQFREQTYATALLSTGKGKTPRLPPLRKPEKSP